tara:strand:+ start:48 stop:440 length:393 start_codon:yes stop_codon:yes gene_type:complete
MNQYEILCDFCNKNIESKKQFVEKLKNNDPASQAYLLSFFATWTTVFNSTGENAYRDFEALGKGLGIGAKETKTIFLEAAKIFKIEANDTTKDLEALILTAYYEGVAAYRAHHVLYVDQKFDWSKIPYTK